MIDPTSPAGREGGIMLTLSDEASGVLTVHHSDGMVGLVASDRTDNRPSIAVIRLTKTDRAALIEALQQLTEVED